MYINTTISLQVLPSATKASHNSYPQPLAALEQKKKIKDDGTGVGMQFIPNSI